MIDLFITHLSIKLKKNRTNHHLYFHDHVTIPTIKKGKFSERKWDNANIYVLYTIYYINIIIIIMKMTRKKNYGSDEGGMQVKRKKKEKKENKK